MKIEHFLYSCVDLYRLSLGIPIEEILIISFTSSGGVKVAFKSSVPCTSDLPVWYPWLFLQNGKKTWDPHRLPLLEDVLYNRLEQTQPALIYTSMTAH